MWNEWPGWYVDNSEERAKLRIEASRCERVSSQVELGLAGCICREGRRKAQNDGTAGGRAGASCCICSA